MSGPTEREREAASVLARVDRDTQTISGSPFARAGARLRDHFSGADAVGAAEGGGTDPIELWGRRIGRALSALLALGLVGLLGWQLGWW